jgi:ribosomal subunit interface protein
MDRPLELAFHNMKSSSELEALVRERVDRLEEVYSHIIGCRVTIELENHTHRTGNIPDVRIDVQVPGESLIVNHQHSVEGDAFTSVHKAFDAVAHQLKGYKARKALHVKLHELPNDEATA